MTDAITHNSKTPIGEDEKYILLGASIAATALVAGAAALAAGLGGGAAGIALITLVALAGMAIGLLYGRRDGVTNAKAARTLMFRVADELAQYRAFTRLLRDQGARIVESTSGAATLIVGGLTEMDASVDRMRVLVDGGASDDAAELRALIEAVSAPVLEMLGTLQFQDVTQQQIAFLSRLSLLLDEHMLAVARNLDDRRSEDRIGRFREMFEQALDDCVMDSQRDDHHTASGVATRETVGAKLELF